MPVSLLERPPVELQPQLSGGAGQPPEMPITTIATAEPPEREQFAPAQEALRTETHEQFSDITQDLGDVAQSGLKIVDHYNSAQSPENKQAA